MTKDGPIEKSTVMLWADVDASKGQDMGLFI